MVYFSKNTARIRSYTLEVCLVSALASEVSTITVSDAVYANGWTIQDLVRETGLNENAVKRAVIGGNHQINYTVADAIARALKISVNELEWPNKITHLGRHAHTGRPIEHIAKPAEGNLCTDCNTLRSLANTCLCA